MGKIRGNHKAVLTLRRDCKGMSRHPMATTSTIANSITDNSTKLAPEQQYQAAPALAKYVE